MEQTNDLRKFLLQMASGALLGGPVDVFGETYVDEEAVQKGFDIIDFVHIMDRKFKK